MGKCSFCSFWGYEQKITLCIRIVAMNVQKSSRVLSSDRVFRDRQSQDCPSAFPLCPPMASCLTQLILSTLKMQKTLWTSIKLVNKTFLPIFTIFSILPAGSSRHPHHSRSCLYRSHIHGWCP